MLKPTPSDQSENLKQQSSTLPLKCINNSCEYNKYSLLFFILAVKLRQTKSESQVKKSSEGSAKESEFLVVCIVHYVYCCTTFIYTCPSKGINRRISVNKITYVKHVDSFENPLKDYTGMSKADPAGG